MPCFVLIDSGYVVPVSTSSRRRPRGEESGSTSIWRVRLCQGCGFRGAQEKASCAISVAVYSRRRDAR